MINNLFYSVVARFYAHHRFLESTRFIDQNGRFFQLQSLQSAPLNHGEDALDII